MLLNGGLQEVMGQWGNDILHSIGLLRGLKLEVTSCQVGNLWCSGETWLRVWNGSL